MLAGQDDHVDPRIAFQSDQNDGPHLMTAILWMGSRRSDFEQASQSPCYNRDHPSHSPLVQDWSPDE